MYDARNFARFFSGKPVGAFWNQILSEKGGLRTENISRARKKELRKPLERELTEYRSQGISLYLDGEPSTPKNIAKACQIAEDVGYMRDYMEDEKGRIARVDFDFIREK